MSQQGKIGESVEGIKVFPSETGQIDMHIFVPHKLMYTEAGSNVPDKNDVDMPLKTCPTCRGSSSHDQVADPRRQGCVLFCYVIHRTRKAFSLSSRRHHVASYGDSEDAVHGGYRAQTPLLRTLSMITLSCFFTAKIL